eukprot:m.415591 g.415591  ORF g.415591 m.415591 type:complete len:245 (+) comp16824_c1_seq6:123-857(+)
MNCTICLDDEGSVVQKGCCCRGDLGAIHIDCLIELATHSTVTLDDFTPWERCTTCGEPYTGDTLTTVTTSWVDRTSTMDPDSEEALASHCALGRVLCDAGKCVDGVAHLTQAYEGMRRVLGEWDRDTVNAALELSMGYCQQAEFVEAERIQVALLEHLKAERAAKAALQGGEEEEGEGAGDEDDQILDVMNSLANTYIDLGARNPPIHVQPVHWVPFFISFLFSVAYIVFRWRCSPGPGLSRVR